MALTIFNSDDKDFMLMQTSWASSLNKMLANPATNGILMKSVQLSTGDNTINHKLGRNLQGWVIVRKRANADIYDTQDSNSMPSLTLTLNSSANVTVDLYLF